jgi:hypothetical protein
VKNCDRNVVSVIGLLSAALLAWPACSEEQPAKGPAHSGESSLGAAPGNPTPAQPPDRSMSTSSENRLDFPPDAGPGPHLVCDPNDSRYCKVSRPEDGAACAERWEDVPARLNCGQLPDGSTWYIHMGPRCLAANWRRRLHDETCYYDSRTGKLIASEASDECGLYCGGLRRAVWNERPDECYQIMPVEAAACFDGSTLPLPQQPPWGVGDGGAPPALDGPRDQRQPQQGP